MVCVLLPEIWIKIYTFQISTFSLCAKDRKLSFGTYTRIYDLWVLEIPLWLLFNVGYYFEIRLFRFVPRYIKVIRRKYYYFMKVK